MCMRVCMCVYACLRVCVYICISSLEDCAFLSGLILLMFPSCWYILNIDLWLGSLRVFFPMFCWVPRSCNLPLMHRNFGVSLILCLFPALQRLYLLNCPLQRNVSFIICSSSFIILILKFRF